MKVIRHDFGKEKRLITRRFRRLLQLDALHEANIRANPLPYLERASERIYQLEKVLFEAIEAAKPALGDTVPTERIEVGNGEYQRLLSCFSIVERGFRELVASDDESS
ncbi:MULTISPECIES: hypothetical protein [unclassified Hyphomicrobium]|uniref:hypothetical protein n=1 Tax=unclassified Hyphomicrobium TaxID=2619925 RepID=UPI000213D614|nr:MULTISPECIES: hypothetical protein [unclassified Hyphomicrobium]CCB66859.1 conserved protein of unknown function [Hyphomicrobium sp. MC1]